MADHKSPAEDARPSIPDNTTLTLAFAPTSKNQWDFAASVLDLFDADEREPAAPGAITLDLPMEPRAFYLRAIYRV